MSAAQVDFPISYRKLEPGGDAVRPVRTYCVPHRLWDLGEVYLDVAVLAHDRSMRPEGVLGEGGDLHSAAYGGADGFELAGDLLHLHTLLGEHGAGALLAVPYRIPPAEELLLAGPEVLFEARQELLGGTASLLAQEEALENRLDDLPGVAGDGDGDA